jgi:hypothetical protein
MDPTDSDPTDLDPQHCMKVSCFFRGFSWFRDLSISYWMQVLDDLELSEVQEVSVLEFCCEVSSMPYNRRTSRSLRDIIRQGKNPQKLLLQLQLVFQIQIWIRTH